MADYTRIGSTARTVVNKMGELQEVIEVLFSWGDNNTGKIQIPVSEANPETIEKAIQDYISKLG